MCRSPTSRLARRSRRPISNGSSGRISVGRSPRRSSGTILRPARCSRRWRPSSKMCHRASSGDPTTSSPRCSCRQRSPGTASSGRRAGRIGGWFGRRCVTIRGWRAGSLGGNARTGVQARSGSWSDRSDARLGHPLDRRLDAPGRRPPSQALNVRCAETACGLVADGTFCTRARAPSRGGNRGRSHASPPLGPSCRRGGHAGRRRHRVRRSRHGGLRPCDMPRAEESPRPRPGRHSRTANSSPARQRMGAWPRRRIVVRMVPCRT